MFESFPSNQESNKKSREEILDALKTKGVEDAETKEWLSTYIEESRLEVEKITDKKEHYRASIECSIRNAELFNEAGYVQEAYDDLLDTLEIAHQAGEEDLSEKIKLILGEIEVKLKS